MLSKSFRALFAVLAGTVAAHTLTAAPARHPTYEPDSPKGKAAPRENLFLKAKTTAKDHWSDRTPALAVNGDLNANSHWASDSLPSWHMIDMGKVQQLSTIQFVPYWPDGRIYQFYIEGSPDGDAWVMLADQRANSINAGQPGFTLTFDPVNVRYVRTTFTANTANKAGHIVSIEGYTERRDDSAITLKAGERWKRYDRDSLADLAKAPESISFRGWKGERVTAMAVVTSPAEFQELRAEARLTGPKNEDIPVRVDFVRYTVAAGELKADILDGTTQTKWKGQTRPIFLSVDIPANAPPSAEGALTVWVNGVKRTLPLALTVDNLTLPPPEQWRVHIDLWQHPDAMARWHDVPLWSPEFFDIARPYMKRLAGIGQKVVLTTLIDEAWNAQTYDWFSSMVRWTKKADGSWHYDYTNFDAWVDFMINDIGIKEQINCYTMIPWTLTFPYFDEAAEKTVAPRLQPGSAEYEAFWGPFLKDFVRHLKEKGWLKITKIAMDERPDHLLKPTLALAAKYAPELEMVTACNHPSNINEAFYNVSYIFNYSEKVIPLASKRAAEGKKTTFYVCTGPRRPNTFLVSDLAEAEWLLPVAARYHLDGFLRWTYQSWVENPLLSTDFTSWPSGDTAIVYPGNRSSLRLEYLREGIESFEKIAILRDLAKKTGREAALKPLEDALEAFTVKRGGQPGIHAEDLIPLNKAFDVVSEAFAR